MDSAGPPALGGGGCGCDAYAPPPPPRAATGGAGGLGGEVYSGAATFGRVYSVIGAVIGVIIGIILVFLGTAKLRDPRTATVTATVTAVSDCAATPGSGQGRAPSVTCVAAATYTVAGTAYTATGISVTQAAAVRKGATLTLRYDPAAPQDAKYELSPDVGWALVAFGLLIGGATTAIAVGAHESKAFAAGYGALEGMSLASNLV